MTLAGVTGLTGVSGVVIVAFSLLVNVVLNAATGATAGAAPQVVPGGFSSRNGADYSQPASPKLAPVRAAVSLK